MPDARWKAFERKTARLLHGKRLPVNGGKAPDVDAGWLVAQCKYRRELPDWLTGALSEIRAQAGSERLGVVVLTEARARDGYVLLSLADFSQWLCNGGENDDNV